MSQGLKASMWAPISATRRPYDLDHHETRSRSLLPPLAGVSAHPNGVNATTKAASSTDTSTTRPATLNDSHSKAGSLARLQSFHRFEQTCHRLRWKFIDLESSYNRALSPSEWGFSPQDAERNFKVDFHEFYAWVEQAVVFLLLVFGVVVEKGARQGGGAGWSSHAYHHNVLRALDDEDNPLHETLGVGDVNQALWKAKELRNRWKDAAEGKETPPLKMYDLRWIVTEVLGGLEAAYAVAGREVEGDLGRENEIGTGGREGEDGWEWMVESMDWEA
ncbi:hypothetical protein QQS21_005970 [Conoideocrella luteorostrata]|uniref:Fungal specific transcription factor n=1 Tax=Conoideocrella luteorostrata TaxID=1105319 RepID=A0AAJ0CNG1_9HYPO|nr:hypothetical protein QQS21_005970 [Conoideocrella luteorostrata]